MRYRLRTLLIAMALVPLLLARVWFVMADPPSTKFGGPLVIAALILVVGTITADLFSRNTAGRLRKLP